MWIESHSDRRFVARLLDPRSRLELEYTGRTIRAGVPYAGSARRLDCHLLWFVEAGAFPLRVGGVELQLGPGDAVWIDHGTAHTFARPPGYSGYAIRFRLGAGRAQIRGEPLLHAARAWTLRAAFAAVVDEARSALPLAAERTRALLAALCVELLRAAAAPVERGLAPAQRHRLLAWVDANLHRAPAPRDLARAIGLGPVHFARCFRRSFGVSPRRWLVDERVRRATELLRSPERGIGEIAAALGCRDARLFSRQFRARHGRSPRQARAE